MGGLGARGGGGGGGPIEEVGMMNGKMEIGEKRRGGTKALVDGGETQGKRREKDVQRRGGGKRGVIEMKLHTWNGEKVGVVIYSTGMYVMCFLRARASLIAGHLRAKADAEVEDFSYAAE